jgi:hypothetical protein
MLLGKALMLCCIFSRDAKGVKSASCASCGLWVRVPASLAASLNESVNEAGMLDLASHEAHEAENIPSLPIENR